MLVPYKSKDDKIAMGLLSYIERFHEIDDLNKEMALIQSGDRRISFWRDEETENVIGLIGYDLREDDRVIVIRYLALSPSFRGEGLSYEILSALAKEYPDAKLSGTLDLSELLHKWATHEQRTEPQILSTDQESGEDHNE